MTPAVNLTFIRRWKKSVWLTFNCILLCWICSSIGRRKYIIFFLTWCEKLLRRCTLLFNIFLILLRCWGVSTVLLLVVSLLHCNIFSCLSASSLWHFLLPSFCIFTLFTHHFLFRSFIWEILLLHRLLCLSNWHLLIIYLCTWL